MLPPMKAFIDFAIKKGVKRFVLMCTDLVEAGGAGMGLVHEYLATLNVEYCALRPYLFGMWSSSAVVPDAICANDKIISTTEHGLIGYMSTEDIAKVALKTLMDEVIENTEPILVGLELVFLLPGRTMLNDILGREIKRKRLTAEECTEVKIQRGMSK
ncbi:hypothetical protein C8R44DRAFT_904218 [Mycena epipterygia]|nr:hypothetical protein C8R44DRAFT_904218 [Mycena epipterygia]